MTESPFPRRSLLAGMLAAGLVPALGITAAHASSQPSASRAGRQPQLAYVGSRTTAARDASGSGITLWRVPADAGPWQLLQTLTADDGAGRAGIAANPTFLTFSADGTRAYCTHGDLALASSFTVDPATGRLGHLNTVDTGHANPVHLSLSPDGRWLVLANFAVPGDLCTLRINDDGSLGAVGSRLQLPGKTGRTRGLQDGPNPHHVPWDPSGRFILVPDRGQDVVHTVSLETGTGTLSLHHQSPTRPADGPRHLLFHPGADLVYIVNEISASVTTCQWNPREGSLTPVHALRTVPPTDLRDMTGAEIAITTDGEHLFVSNRSGTGGADTAGPGNDSVTVMKLDREGIPEIQRTLSTLGQRPRFIGTDLRSRHLYMANEISGSIAHVPVSEASTPGGKARIVARTGSPVCIIFRPHPGTGQ